GGTCSPSSATCPAGPGRSDTCRRVIVNLCAHASIRLRGGTMAKRRKVGNLLALAVLATVTRRPMHPYEMASLLRAHGKEDDMEIKWGSLCTVVRNLA